MQRYFVPEEGWQENMVRIIGDDRHHIDRVMRMQSGDSIICNAPEGRAAVCTINDVTDQYISATIDEWLDEMKELPVEVTIAHGLPKGDKLELVLQKGTELGAASFIPFQAGRSIVKWDQKKAEKKLSRYRKIVKEASEQSHRTVVPEVEGFLDFESLLKKSEDYPVKIFAYEDEAKTNDFHGLSGILSNVESGQKIIACIGPEGGYTIEEAEALKAHGFEPVRLGPRILRTETAPLYLLASISYHFEELGC
ncbi:16S rRNA (uracil(1498)-N(3))-methyltransferase [Sediminibacillus dalangtanensis]|uniref:Ribosomal RNA small subunit methyltransferase E n=1 Tax=Sediminibacillus dalangtanensis TaxID=2729421 RepID=A0ABX7VSF0_9BACI|nr:16S rRNA (uracil(1498)-N(3))-methyltransferase [Sediminibacillus dalangtanensis]QTM99874.1 16S rRNA (uracil(1498)-N(3))-methyltransferase [Sediminibacillus dalangtanensis]